MAKDDPSQKITGQTRERGQTIHLIRELENGEITPEQFATIRSEIVGAMDVVRFVKSIVSGPARRRSISRPSADRDTTKK